MLQQITGKRQNNRIAMLRDARPGMAETRDELQRRLENIERWFARFGKRRHETVRRYLPIMTHERAVLRAKLKFADRVLAQVDAQLAAGGNMED